MLSLGFCAASGSAMSASLAYLCYLAASLMLAISMAYLTPSLLRQRHPLLKASCATFVFLSAVIVMYSVSYWPVHYDDPSLLAKGVIAPLMGSRAKYLLFPLGCALIWFSRRERRQANNP